MRPFATSVTGLPSVLMVAPIIIPFAAALTPVANSPVLSAALPFAYVTYSVTTVTSVLPGDDGAVENVEVYFFVFVVLALVGGAFVFRRLVIPYLYGRRR